MFSSMKLAATALAMVAVLATAPLHAGATDAEGTAFLQAKAAEDDVVSLPSGLLYKVLKSGPDGAPSPDVDTPCDCHYTGTLITGETFDSSIPRGEPSKFAPNQVIAGWTEAMQLMKEGDKWQLYIPSELAYGTSGAGSQIKANNALMFVMEIVKVHVGEKANMWTQFIDFATKRVFSIPFTDDFIFVVRLWHVACLYIFMTYGSFGLFGGSGGSASASHILVKDIKECERIKADIAKAKDPTAAFKEAAMKHSTCPSGKKGGSLGEFTQGQMVPEFDTVCFGDCPVGEVQGPLTTGFGHHLIIVHARSTPKAKEE